MPGMFAQPFRVSRGGSCIKHLLPCDKPPMTLKKKSCVLLENLHCSRPCPCSSQGQLSGFTQGCKICFQDGSLTQLMSRFCWWWGLGSQASRKAVCVSSHSLVAGIQEQVSQETQGFPTLEVTWCHFYLNLTARWKGSSKPYWKQSK